MDGFFRFLCPNQAAQCPAWMPIESHSYYLTYCLSKLMLLILVSLVASSKIPQLGHGVHRGKHLWGEHSGEPLLVSIQMKEGVITMSGRKLRGFLEEMKPRWQLENEQFECGWRKGSGVRIE